MIHKLVLQNFKGIEAAELTFERLTVLVGPNASGKTSVLQALELLGLLAAPEQFTREQVVARYGGLSAILKRGGEFNMAIEAEGLWEAKQSKMRVELKQATSGQRSPTLQVYIGRDGQFFEVPDNDNQMPLKRKQSSSVDPDGQAFLKNKHPPLADSDKYFLSDWCNGVLLRLEAPRLAEPSFTYADSVVPMIDTNGAGLASMLAYMALSQPDDFSALTASVRAVIPQIRRVKFSFATIKTEETENIQIGEEEVRRRFPRTHSGQRIVFDMVGASDIPSEAASEGTLLVLGLLAVLFINPKPKLLLLDDLDRGLHPRAQRDLVAQLRKLLEQDPELQIIATSHSPYLLDNLDPKEVRLSNVLPDGTIRFAALTDHPNFERWKGVMHPGEFWSTVGEKWVGEPRKEQTDG
jgi:predicted ATPase